MEEFISIQSPQGSTHTIRLDVKYDEDDVDIARRFSRTAEVGTVLTIAGSKYRIDGPGKVAALDRRRLTDDDEKPRKPPKRPSSPPLPQGAFASKPLAERQPRGTNGVSIGQRWRSKDKRRSTVFTVARVEGDHLWTEDGRSIKLDRLSRYDLLV